MRAHETVRQARLDGRVAGPLPAQIIAPSGTPHVDYRAVLSISIPMMANSAIQILLSLTDTWFLGHLSTQALAAAGASQSIVLFIVIAAGGAAAPVQTMVARSFGAGRYMRAGAGVWTGLWAVACITPIIVVLADCGTRVIGLFGLQAEIARSAADFWLPRVIGLPFGIATTAILSFFYGIGRAGTTITILIVEILVNAVLNQLFIFTFDWGISGCGWASTVAQGVAFFLALKRFLSTDYRRTYRSHLTWKPRATSLLAHLRLGIPMGLMPFADFIGFSIFQLMQVRLGSTSGAATQMVATLEAVVYTLGAPIASAGTTLVAQSIGAGEALWAKYLGTRVIILTALLTGAAGLIVAMAGPLVLPLFVRHSDMNAAAVMALARTLLWVAAGYQFFEGINVGGIMCLRGVGDAAVPTALSTLLACLVFLPLAHSFTFSHGGGWVHFLPQFGWGGVGGWAAADIYVFCVGCTMFVRWYSSPWAPTVARAAHR